MIADLKPYPSTKDSGARRVGRRASGIAKQLIAIRLSGFSGFFD